MTGNEKGRKKRNRITLRVRFKEKQSVNGIAYPYLRWRSKSIHYMPNQKSGRGSFRHFYFSNITFHFYMYKVLRGDWGGSIQRQSFRCITLSYNPNIFKPSCSNNFNVKFEGVNFTT